MHNMNSVCFNLSNRENGVSEKIPTHTTELRIFIIIIIQNEQIQFRIKFYENRMLMYAFNNDYHIIT